MLIPYARQNITDQDLHEVQKVLRSLWLTQGPTIDEFEKAIADYCGAEHAVSVSNATSGLHIACLALGLGEGDRLWTSPNSFVASANCALYCNAKVDFVDIDPRTYNMCPEALARKLEQAKRDNQLPKIVIPVHFSGQSADMKAIRALADQYHFHIIEDASHAIGGSYLDDKIGHNQFSDITVFSFHPVKIITTGEGGMLLTNNKELFQKLFRLRSHGITRDPEFMVGESEGPWYYQQTLLGYNYRMTDIQAALGLSQMQRLDQNIARRREIARCYHQELKKLPITLPWQNQDAKSAWHLYVIQTESERKRLELFNSLREAQISVNVHYIPIHLQPYYRSLGFKPGDFPIAEAYYQRAISIPMFYGLTDSEQEYVIETLEKCLK